jgi:myo-inositol 2-dehydrogenase/D-chiro-inositol 1-dehydrogenase
MSPLKVGMIGCGRMGTAHLRNLVKWDDVQMVAVCDQIAEVREAAGRLTGAKTYADPYRMLDEADLDAVYVATNTGSHADLGVAVLDSGRHLFLEKPLAFSAEDARRLVEKAQTSSQIHAVGHQWRYLRGVDVARDVLGDRPISVLNLRYYWTWPLVGWIADRATGGGQVMDQGIHLLDLARYFAGDAGDLAAYYTLNARKQDQFPNWDGQVVIGRFDSGAVFSLTATYALFKEIAEPAQVDVIAKDTLIQITPKETRVLTPQTATIHYESESAVEREDRMFVQACLSGNSNLVRSTIVDAAKSLAMVFAANASAETASMRPAVL